MELNDQTEPQDHQVDQTDHTVRWGLANPGKWSLSTALVELFIVWRVVETICGIVKCTGFSWLFQGFVHAELQY